MSLYASMGPLSISLRAGVNYLGRERHSSRERAETRRDETERPSHRVSYRGLGCYTRQIEAAAVPDYRATRFTSFQAQRERVVSINFVRLTNSFARREECSLRDVARPSSRFFRLFFLSQTQAQCPYDCSRKLSR